MGLGWIPRGWDPMGLMVPMGLGSYGAGMDPTRLGWIPWGLRLLMDLIGLGVCGWDPSSPLAPHRWGLRCPHRPIDVG